MFLTFGTCWGEYKAGLLLNCFVLANPMCQLDGYCTRESVQREHVFRENSMGSPKRGLRKLNIQDDILIPTMKAPDSLRMHLSDAFSVRPHLVFPDVDESVHSIWSSIVPFFLAVRGHSVEYVYKRSFSSCSNF